MVGFELNRLINITLLDECEKSRQSCADKIHMITSSRRDPGSTEGIYVHIQRLNIKPFVTSKEQSNPLEKVFKSTDQDQ